MVELTSELVVRLLRRANPGVRAGADDPRWIEVAKEPANRVGFMLASLRRLEGRPLGDRHERELAAFCRQRDRYARLLDRLRQACPSLYQIKGTHLQELYPPGVVRDSNDLDLVVPDPADLRAAVGLLGSAGFEPLLCGVDLVPAGSYAYHLGLRCTRHAGPDHPTPDYVELANYSLVGNHLVPPSFVDLRAMPSPAFGNVLTTLRERFEQPYRVRDLLDAALSLERLAPEQAVRLGRAAVRLRTAPELVGVLRALRRAGLTPPADRLPAVSRAEVAAETGRRLRRRARHLARPQVMVSRWRGETRPEWTARVLRAVAGSGLFSPEPVEHLVGCGLRATGLLVDPDAAAELSVAGNRVVTPAGTFAVSTRRDDALAARTRVAAIPR